MNNAAWKAVTIRSGSPGTNWVFGMSGAQDMPTSGFALSAWAGARQTFLAAQIPTIKGTSLDGRCMLAAKATNTGGQWHYVYALLNIDLASQAGAFSVPVLGANVTDANFHSPEHHNEPLSGGGNALQMNDAWAINVSPSGVLWSTTMNPLHWGDVYTFSFTSTKAPVDGEVTVSLFRNNGSPLKGVTVVPGK